VVENDIKTKRLQINASVSSGENEIRTRGTLIRLL